MHYNALPGMGAKRVQNLGNRMQVLVKWPVTSFKCPINVSTHILMLKCFSFFWTEVHIRPDIRTYCGELVEGEVKNDVRHLRTVRYYLS